MFGRFAVIAVFVLSLVACSEAPTPPAVNSISGSTMGTTYHISWVTPDGSSISDAELQGAVDARLKAINKTMSTYDSDSELSILNKQSPVDSSAVGISQDLGEVLSIAKDIFEKSNGLFDITVGPLVNAWGFGPTPDIHTPLSDSEILELKQGIGSQYWNIPEDHKNVISLIRDKSLYMDLSAVAKGWAVDELGELLESKGINSYLAEIGGELKIHGVKPNGESWRIAIERPGANPMEAQQVQMVLSPGNMGVATSGDYRNYFESDGKRYSHTINPFTGRPIEHKLASVTVVHDDCANADAWATALNVAGPEKGLELANKYDLAVYMIVREGKGFEEVVSKAFESRYGHPAHTN